MNVVKRIEREFGSLFCSLKIVHEAKKLDEVKSRKATKTPSVTKCKDEF